MLLAPSSQLSAPSVTPSPHVLSQSVSFVVLQPSGQQPSSCWHWVMGAWVHDTLQVSAEPCRLSRVHACESSQSVGQLPSQVSDGSTRLLPQVGGLSVVDGGSESCEHAKLSVMRSSESSRRGIGGLSARNSGGISACDWLPELRKRTIRCL